VPTFQLLSRAALALAAFALCAALDACGGGGGASAGSTNPWSGTHYTQFVMKGDTPANFLGPDGADPLIQAQVRQALNDRTYELGLYAVANASGSSQQTTLFDTPVLSYLYNGQTGYQIPGQVELLGGGLARLDLTLAGPQYAWQTLTLRGTFDAAKVNDLVSRIFPNRFSNIVAGETVSVDWEVTGLNGSRPVQLTCTQNEWIYSMPGAVR
jgi:hypothetical protein